MKFRFLSAVVILISTVAVRAWDYEGHRIVNQIALASLPTNFPAFVLTPEARERVAFLAGEADRWRNTTDLSLKHCNGPDHYMDLEELMAAGVDLKTLPQFRFDFTVMLDKTRAAHPQHFAPIKAEKDADHTRALVGFLPWAIVENQGKLKSGFSYLGEFEKAGRPEEIANAQQNILYVMGVMGHYIGDGAQPLHTTKHHHGWVGPNPKGYSTNYSIHAWIDGGYLGQFGITFEKLRSRVRPAKVFSAEGSSTNMFPTAMAYLIEQQKQVEPLYKLEKAGKLSGRRERDDEGYEFICGQLLRGGQMLGDLWLTAWQTAGPDTFLRSALAKRKLTEENGGTPPPKKSR